MSATPWGLVAAGIGLVVGVVSEIAMHAGNAVDKIEQLRNESDEAAQSAENYANKANSLREAQKRYDEIYNSEKSAYEKGEELKALQEELIAQYPDLVGRIDLATGAYKDQAEAIRECISESEAYALEQAQINRDDNNALEEIERGRTFQAAAVEFNSFNDDNVRKIIEHIAKNNENVTTEALRGAAGGFSLSIKGDSAEKQAAIDEIIKAFQKNGYNELYKEDFKKLVNYATPYAEQAKKTKQARDYYEKLNEKDAADYAGSARFAEEWAAAQNPYDDEEEPAAVSEQKRSTDELKKLYDQEKQLADDRYSVGEISAEEYYNKLKELRDKYLQAQSHEWYQATAQIQSVYDKWTNAAKKSSTAVKSSLDEVQSAYKATLAAIDAEYEKHKRQKSDLEFQAKIDEIEKELQYGRVDEFERYELEKKKKQLVEQRDEELYSRSVSDAKSAVTDAYNARQALENADIGTREYTRALGDYTDKLGDLNEAMRAVGQQIGVQNGGSSVSNIDESTKNNYINVILQAVNKSNSQIVDELMKALKSGL